MKRTMKPAPGKKPYRKPTLTRYGTVSAMTRQFSNSRFSDAGNNRMAPFAS
jgi:hypothetical protein